MKAVILAGGKGTRLSEETQSQPKPLVEAAGFPLVWHVMQSLAAYGITEFIVLAGYKSQLIREYFANFWLNQTNITFDLSQPLVQVNSQPPLNWKVTVLDTGLETLTGGRIAQLSTTLTERFLLTYGDSIGTVDIDKLVERHLDSGCLATLTAVQPPARFGALEFQGAHISSFSEKPKGDGAWVNGGYFVLEPEVFKFLGGPSSSFEIDTLPLLARKKLLSYYKHTAFWQPVDTIRDLKRLEESIDSGCLPWMENLDAI